MNRRLFLLALAGSALLPAGLAAGTGRLVPGLGDALLMIDMQTCFMPGGTLPVADGTAISLAAAWKAMAEPAVERLQSEAIL